MKKITIEFIPDDQHRVWKGNKLGPGDWYFDEKGDLVVPCTDLGNDYYNFLLGRHEMDEAMLCKKNGIPVEELDDSDTAEGSDADDPDSFSGYRGARFQPQHNDALASEWQMSRLLDVDWVEYGKAFNKFWDAREAVKNASPT
jgi:hypothetical protein